MRTELSNDVIKIRRYRDEDMKLLYEAAIESIDEMKQWMPWCHDNYSIEDSKDFIYSRKKMWEEKLEFDFAVFDKVTDKYLGGVGLNKFDKLNKFANLGYWVRSSETGRGAATAAIILMSMLSCFRLFLIKIKPLRLFAS